MPAWVDRGAIVGIQGGTDVVRQRVADLQAAGVPLAGVWLQDWVGQRVTNFGSRLLWNWTLNTQRYPGWQQMVRDFRAQGIRVMTYINPMLADAAGIPGPERNLYAEALERGYVIRHADGSPYLVDQGGFTSALIDLTSAPARAWTVGVLRDMAVKFGASGWMADFAEQTPFAGRFANGASGATEHNRFPDRWSDVQASALRNLPDVVDFHRAAFTRSPRSARLFWMGDQTVNWSERDGMRSALTGMLSGGMSGFSLNHSDTGGYTTLVDPPVQRTEELLDRWAEMNAFGGAMLRSHEGNRPQLNVSPTRAQASPAPSPAGPGLPRAGPLSPGPRARGRADGMPIVRPLWFSDPALDDVTHAFTLGARRGLGRARLRARCGAHDAAAAARPLGARLEPSGCSPAAARASRSTRPSGDPAVFVRAGVAPRRDDPPRGVLTEMHTRWWLPAPAPSASTDVAPGVGRGLLGRAGRRGGRGRRRVPVGPAVRRRRAFVVRVLLLGLDPQPGHRRDVQGRPSYAEPIGGRVLLSVGAKNSVRAPRVHGLGALGDLGSGQRLLSGTACMIPKRRGCACSFPFGAGA